MEKRVQILPREFYLRTQEKVCVVMRLFAYVSTESIHRGTFMPAKCLIARYIAAINGRIIKRNRGGTLLVNYYRLRIQVEVFVGFVVEDRHE